MAGSLCGGAAKVRLMFRTAKNISHQLSTLTINGLVDWPLALQRQRNAVSTKLGPLFPVFLAILIGAGMGILALVALGSSRQWKTVIVLAAMTPLILLLFKDPKKLILAAILIDIPLGIDIALQNHGWHRGGPTGYIVSLMTFSLILGYALWIIEQKPKVQFFPAVTIFALLELATSVFSFYQSPHWQLTAFGLFAKVQTFLMFLYLANHVRTWADIRLVITVTTVCLLLESSLMSLQYFTDFSLELGGLVKTSAIDMNGNVGVTGSRVTGTLSVPSVAAAYLNSTMTLVLGAYLARRRLVDKRLALIAFMTGVIALIGTSSRGGWISFAVAMAVILGQSLWNETTRKKVPLFVVGAVLVALFFGRQIEERIVTVAEETSRQYLAGMAYNIIAAHPLGVGDNTYDLFIKDKYAPLERVGKYQNVVHSKYLMVWAQLGTQGIVVFILLLIAIAYQARWWLFKTTVDPDLAILGAGLLGGFLTHVIHSRSEPFVAGPVLKLFWLIVALMLVVNSFIQKAPEEEEYA